ncbi:hypothetical protein D3C78_1875950 [compost metagenome]
MGNQDADHGGAQGAADGARGLHQRRRHAYVSALAQHLHEERQVGQEESQRAAVDEEGAEYPPGRSAR